MHCSKSLRFALLGVVTLTVLPLAAADAGLLNLVMPDARLVAGVSIDQARGSAFGQYVLSRLQAEDEGFRRFMEATGFDPRRDLTEVLLASPGAGHDTGLVVARGSFNPQRMLDHAAAHGGLVSDYKGVSILTAKTVSGRQPGAVAFLSGSIAVAGDPDNVRAAVDRYSGAPGGLGPQLDAKARDLSARYDVWMVSTLPVSEFAGRMPDARVGPAMKGDVAKTIEQLSGGVKFHADMAQMDGEAVTTTEKDATALADVIRFLSSLVQMNRTPETTDLNAVLQTMQLSNSGNTLKVSVSVPEEQLERLVQPRKSRARPRARASVVTR